eukprot:12140789-Alexandrium_andersonii.AAC.1
MTLRPGVRSRVRGRQGSERRWPGRSTPCWSASRSSQAGWSESRRPSGRWPKAPTRRSRAL